ncbi:AMP-dependent synthetase [Actinomadura sp. CNU-125]|uniref:class I adenylate-forming enzyme family protein n=1 Tax=Actinomadura sp. CNU-125 TaxID=1904961 RepID=UPI00096339AA|nr:AMP-binding protein [Actinomadura sp. CNU-125]OLT20833.1 AMP-dependent synthetase [Actinomadura sp. CNU-125]
MPNIAEAVWLHACTVPDAICLRGAAEPWTYRTLRDRAAAIAGRLREYGVRPGHRVLLIAPTDPEFAAVYYGIHAAGAIAVTVNTMSTRPELEYIGADAGAELIIDLTEIAPAPAAAAEALDIPCWRLRRCIADEAAIDAPYPRDDGDTAAILYTSGTTGRPKGVQLTHGNMIAASSIIRDAHGLTPADRGATALPLFHVFGQACVLNTVVQAGASLSLLARFEPESMMAMLRRDDPTFLAGVPTMWNALLHTVDDAAKFGSLRHASSGGASLPGEVMRAFEERFRCIVFEGYGLTESTGVGTYQPAHRERKAGFVGVAFPGCVVTVHDDEGNELPNGEVGEVRISGPVVMKGYWQRPEATTEALPDGRLRTGDLGVKDADGDLRIVGRKKEMVIRGGYNVYPSEVEEVLYRHPDVVEAAVIGVPDDHYGEEVAAAITLRPGTELTPETLRSWAKEHLSAYKIPRLISVMDELPKGPTGKILKQAIPHDLFVRRE